MKQRLVLIFALVLVASVGAAIAIAQTDAPAGGAPAPATTTPPATPAPVAPVAQPPAPPLPPATRGLDFKLAALSSETFVMVKDQGDYQTVIVYKVSPAGKVQQTDRRNFFYQAP